MHTLSPPQLNYFFSFLMAEMRVASAIFAPYTTDDHGLSETPAPRKARKGDHIPLRVSQTRAPRDAQVPEHRKRASERHKPILLLGCLWHLACRAAPGQGAASYISYTWSGGQPALRYNLSTLARASGPLHNAKAHHSLPLAYNTASGSNLLQVPELARIDPPKCLHHCPNTVSKNPRVTKGTRAHATEKRKTL